jgi:RHS repeat-associated protein
VTDNGAATYQIPLWVPPGRKGVQPKLALAYSSEGGEGIMGLGWHVDGLSTISRCPQDYARDGKPRAIQFDNDDRLCLDGERLVLASGSPGEYNKAGSEYRTENDKHMKIVQVGADLNPALGPTGFLVYLPDGTRRSYGYDTSASLSGFDGSASAVLQANRATVTASASDSNDPTVAYDTPVRLAWALASWRDRYDNEVSYSYIQGENSTKQDRHFILDFRPQQIAYTGEPAGAETRFVTFAYDEDSLKRKDIRESFVGGLPLRIGHLLTSITMEGPSPDTRKVLRKYKLTYQNDPERALVKTVSECDGASICKPATTFDWTTQPDGAQFDRIDTKIEDMKDFGRVVSIPVPGVTYACQPGAGVVVVGDMNGDGYDDIMLSVLTNVGTRYWVRATAVTDPAVAAATPFGPLTTIDGPGDNCGENAIVWTSTGRALDLDSNGTAELVVPRFSGSCADWSTGFATIGSISPGHDPVSSIWRHNETAPWPYVGDFDGDGLPDVIRASPSPDLLGAFRLQYRLNAPSGVIGDFNTVLVPSGPLRVQTQWNGFVADIDGDGKAEFLYNQDISDLGHPGTRMLAVGDLAAPAASPNASSRMLSLLASRKFPDSVYYQMADVNGDGLPDAIEITNDGVRVRVAINNGRDFLPPVAITIPDGFQIGQLAPDMAHPTDPGTRVIDFDMDGRADLLLMGDGCMNYPPGETHRRIVSVLKATPGPAFTGQLGVGGPAGFPLVGEPSINWDDPYTGNLSACLGAYRTSQVLDFNGDGLADFIQLAWQDQHSAQCSMADRPNVNKATLVLYVRRGPRPGLLKGITDGFKNSTQVDWTPITDTTIHRPLDAASCSYPQRCNIRGKWIVKGHTLASGSSSPLGFEHHYYGARSDLTGLGYLGMDAHTVTDLVTKAVVRTSYDHTVASKEGAVFYPKLNRPKTRIETYPISPTWEIQRVQTSDCELLVEDNNTRVVEKSCDDELVQSEGAVLASPLPQPPVPLTMTKRRRVHTDYSPDYGYVTGRTTSIGFADTLLDHTNEYSTLTRSDFSKDNEQEWLLGMALTEDEVSYVPARSDSGTVAEQRSRRTKYDYDSNKGAVLQVELEPDSTDSGVYRKTQYQPNQFGQVTLTTVSGLDQRSRYIAADYAAPGDVFPASVRAGGTSPVAAEQVPEQKTTYSYHQGLGLVMQATDPAGVSMVQQYDTFGRPRTKQNADGSIASWQYQADTAHPFQVSSMDHGKGLVQLYDLRGLLTEMDGIDEVGQTFVASQIEYEAHGWMSKRTRPIDEGQSVAQYYTSYLHDPLGRPTRQSGPVGTTTWTYLRDKTTRTIKGQSVNPGATPTDQVDSSYEDQSGRVIKRVEEMGTMPTKPGDGAGTAHDITTLFVYGPFGTVRRVIDTQKNPIVLDYDDRGRRSAVQDPDVVGQRTFSYDTFNQLTSTVVDGRQRSFVYDVLGRRISEVNTEGTSTFAWDTAVNGMGRLASTKNAHDNVTAAYEYDQQGRPAAEIHGISGASYRLDFGYDDMGRTKSVVYPQAGGSRYSAGYGYSGNSGELQTVSDGSGNPLWHADSRNLDKRVTQETFGDSSVANYTYEPERGLLSEILVTAGGGGPVSLSVAYVHDTRGYLSDRYEYLGASHETFTHDDLGRLTHWASDGSGGWSVHYDYDDIGNLGKRERKTADGSDWVETFTSGPCSSGRWGGPHAVTAVLDQVSSGTGGQSASLGYWYDNAGRQYKSDTRTITYTDFDLPRQIQMNATTWDFQYDADHRRASKVDSQGWGTIYVGKLYERRTTPGRVTHVMYVKGERGQVIAQVTQADAGGSPTVEYLHSDHLGSVTNVTGSEGSKAEMRFDPFGERIQTTGPPTHDTNPLPNVTLGFTGEEHDDGLGLINLNGRIYDPNLMRFLTPDPFVTRPLNSQEYNRYSYANNSPFRFVDTTGFQEGGGDGGDSGEGEGEDDDSGDGERLGGAFELNEISKLPSLPGEGPAPNPSTNEAALRAACDQYYEIVIHSTRMQASATDDQAGSGMSSSGDSLSGRAALHQGLRNDSLRDLWSGAKNGLLNLVPGYYNSQLASNALNGGDYGRYAVNTIGAAADIGLAILTIGTMSLLEDVGRGLAAGVRAIATPWGVAIQEATPAAEAALSEARSGATLFRQGTFGVQETSGAQFWSLSNPAATPGYAAQVGMPGGTAVQADWIMGGTLQKGGAAISRAAPGIGANTGGAVEVVVPPGGVSGLWFVMP